MASKSHLKPRHTQLADQLKQRLILENLRPGDKFLTVREIAEEYEVSVVTSHRSIQQLIEADLLRVEKFKGCFVGSAVRNLKRTIARPLITVLTPESVFSHAIVPEVFIRGLRQTLPHARVTLEYLPANDLLAFLDTVAGAAPAGSNPPRAFVLRSVDPVVKKFFADRGLPAIVMGSVEPGINLPSVQRDERQVAYSVTQHLLAKGHRHIAYIEWDVSLMGLERRREGFVQAMTEAGLIQNAQEADLMIDHAPPHQGDTTTILRRYLDRRQRPTAVIFGLEQQAAWGLKALQQWNVQIPNELAVISLEGGVLTSHLVPRITAVSQNHYEGGVWVGNLAAKLLKGEAITEQSHLIPASIDDGETT